MKEDRLAIMPALDDMLGHVHQTIAGESGHGQPHDSVAKIVFTPEVYKIRV
jgi:hypothetical protein